MKLSLITLKINNAALHRLWSRLVLAGEEAPRRGIRLAARLLRILLMAAISFAVNEVPVRAAALTFATLLAFFPFAIILSSVAGQLGYLDLLSRLVPFLAASFHIDLPVDPLLAGLERAQGMQFHQLGIWGSLGLLFGFFLSMSTIESAVNRVWNLRKERGWGGQFRVYTPFLLLLTALVLLSARILLFIRDAFQDWSFGQDLPSFLPRGGLFLFGATGVLVFVWLGLVLMIRVLPNTKVKWPPALLGATVATAAIYLLSRVLYLFPRLLLDRNSLLYGSLAIVPVLLLLLYAFWAAALFGAAVAFIDQRLYRQGAKEKVSPDGFGAALRGALRLWDALRNLERGEGAGKPVPLDSVAQRIGESPERVEEWTLPLTRLGWIKRKSLEGKAFLLSNVGEDEVNLTELHALMARLDPEGTGSMKDLAPWHDLLQDVKVLYSSRRDLPGISLAMIRKPEVVR